MSETKTFGGTAASVIVQTRNSAHQFSIVCARCTKPITGDEVFKVGRYTYGACCILKVEEGIKK